MGILINVSLRAVATVVLLLNSHIVPEVAAKSQWVRKGGQRNKVSNLLRKELRLNNKHQHQATTLNVSTTTCSEAAAKIIKAPRANVWAELTDVEAASVVAWLFDQRDLNLTTTEVAQQRWGWDNTVLLVEALRPNKTDALAFLDKNQTAPKRYAHVILDNRATEEAYWADIVVGPLPIDNVTTKWEALTWPFTKYSNKGRVRNLAADDMTLLEEWKNAVGASVADITLHLWNGTVMGLDNDTLDIWGIDPLWQEDGRVVRWDTFWNTATSGFDSETLLPLGLFFMSDVTGRNSSQWTLEGWLYNGIFYKTTDDFRRAYWSHGFARNGPNVDGSWAHTDTRGPPLRMDTQHPPTQIAPAGSRFFIDPEERYVEWMGWSFYMGFSRDSGMALFDIQHDGERLLYELGLQEALAHYAGNDPVASGTSYLDTWYGFGPYMFELVPGYDCPAYATYLNSSFYVGETTHTHIGSICLFEFDGDFPMQRHSTSGYVSVTKNTRLTVRSVSTVGNYDYMFSYTFSMDGLVAVEVRASGYIQGAYFAANSDYGFRIQDNLSGSMHDHVLNFKADFDVLGTQNSIQLMTHVPTTEVYPWSRGKPRNTMKLERRFIETEDESRLNWDSNCATQLLVVNENAPNRHGEYRGYRVLPYTSTAHLTVVNSSNLVNAARWAEYDVQITRQKDTEPRSAHAANSQDVHDPPVDFSRFFDGESLRNEDLVVWVNLGMHHVPHTGDLPNTVFTTAHSGVQFMPSNYFDGDVSRRTVNMVRVDYDNGTTTAVETFGQRLETTCGLDFAPVEPDLWGYTGDVVVRKFPFDPNNPFFETISVL